MHPIKILILTANPRNTDRLQLEQEIREIKAELDRSKLRDQFEIITEGAVRVTDLSHALLRHIPAIVHFSGHGAGENGLALENDKGDMQLVPTDALVELFRLSKTTVKCVFLNACYSEVQADAIYKQIDCVVGMNQAIGDKTAIQFSPKFYAALSHGRSFQDAFDFAKNFLQLDKNREVSTPILKIRQGAANLFPQGYDTNNLLAFSPSSKKHGKRLVLVLTADIDEIHKPLVEAIVAHLQKLSGDSSLTLTSIEVGSVKLIFDGSDEGFARIESLVQSGQLTELNGFPIQNVHYAIRDKRRDSGGGDDWLPESSAFYSRNTEAEAAYHEPRQFDRTSGSSHTIGNISITGDSNSANFVQGNSNTISQNVNQPAASSDLQAAIAALAQLKEAIANTEALDDYDKSRAQSDVEFIEKQLKQPKPDKSAVDRAIGALKIAFEGVVTLAEPVKKIAELLAKSWMV